MAKSAASGRNGFDALGSGSDAVLNRHRPHPRSRPSTAIVVEQRPLIRELLSRSLRQRAGFEVFATASIDEYLESSEGNDVSLVLVSIAGNSNSEETRRTLRRAAEALPNTPVVVLSDSEDFQNILSILQSGTRGYISTAMTLDVAIEALWLVQAGGQFLPATCIIGLGRSDAESAAAPLRPRVAEIFTARQAEVVKELCQGKANKIIAYELKMKESTVKVHVRNIMRKLKAKNRTEVAYITNQLLANAQET
jgi:DNA-binding NarL/FixJ family response regulator